MNYISEKVKANLVIRKISYQFKKDIPEARLMFSIIEQAIKDCASEDKREANTGRSYLRGEIPHAEVCGVDANWIRWVIKKVGLSINHAQYQ